MARIPRISVQEYQGRALPPTMSRPANNQSEVSQRPDPNNGMDVYKRNNPVGIQGTHGIASEFANPMNDHRAPLSLVGLDAAANLTDQGDSAAYNRENQAFVKQGGAVERTNVSQADSQRLAAQDRMNKLAVGLINPEGRRYAQSLMSAGVGHLNTDVVHEAAPYQGSSFGLKATRGGKTREQGGFFDEQDHDSLDRLKRLDRLPFTYVPGTR